MIVDIDKTGQDNAVRIHGHGVWQVRSLVGNGGNSSIHDGDIPLLDHTAWRDDRAAQHDRRAFANLLWFIRLWFIRLCRTGNGGEAEKQKAQEQARSDQTLHTAPPCGT